MLRCLKPTDGRKRRPTGGVPETGRSRLARVVELRQYLVRMLAERRLAQARLRGLRREANRRRDVLAAALVLAQQPALGEHTNELLAELDDAD